MKAENSDKEEKHDCEEDGVNYLHRKEIDKWYTDASLGKTDTWQECQKKCAENSLANSFLGTTKRVIGKNTAHFSTLLHGKRKDTQLFPDRGIAQRVSSDFLIKNPKVPFKQGLGKLSVICRAATGSGVNDIDY